MLKKSVLLLILSIIVSFTSACGNVAENPGGETPGERKQGLDLDGYNFQYYRKKTLGYTEDTLFADLAMQHVADVENNLNCKIEFIDGDFESELTKALAASLVLCDAGTGSSYSLQPQIRSGSLLPISAVESILDFKTSPKNGETETNSRAMSGTMSFMPCYLCITPSFSITPVTLRFSLMKI